MLNERAVEWLESRRIDPEIAAKMGLASVAEHGGEGLKIPYLVGADVVNHKYRTLADKRFRQDKGAVKCLWNFNALCDATLADQPLIITEGEMDALAAIQAGFQRVVSVPDGAPSGEQGDNPDTSKYTYLDHAKSALKDVREIILAVDGDEAGKRLLNDLAIRLGKARCKWIRYPKGCKDLNDALAKYGERGVVAAIQTAQYVHVDGVYRMSDLPPYPDRQGMSTGMTFLDPHYKIRLGDFCVVTGIPSLGKTTFVNDLCCRVAEKHGWNIAWASFEQHPQADHRRALREWHLRRPMYQCLPEDIERADAWIDERFSFIVPGDDDLATLDWFLDAAATAVIRYGAKVVVVDPWNEMDHERPRDSTLTEYTGFAIKEFKRFARRFDVHVIVVAHPTKLAAGDKPSLYSISDSAHWANKADVGLIIHRDNPEDSVSEIRVAKSRYHDLIGRPGTVYANYHRDSRRFQEVPSEWLRAREEQAKSKRRSA
jgi:twinkle protein